MRACWNRQTGTFEGRVSTDVWVQVPLLAPNIAGLCKGSTADSDSVCLGSNPSPAAIVAASLLVHRIFYIKKYGFTLSAAIVGASYISLALIFLQKIRVRFCRCSSSFAKRHSRLACSLASALSDGSLSLSPFCEVRLRRKHFSARRFYLLFLHFSLKDNDFLASYISLALIFL